MTTTRWKNIENSTIFNQKPSAKWYLVGLCYIPSVLVCGATIAMLVSGAYPVYQWVSVLIALIMVVVNTLGLVYTLEIVDAERIRRYIPVKRDVERARWAMFTEPNIHSPKAVVFRPERSCRVDGIPYYIMNSYVDKVMKDAQRKTKIIGISAAVGITITNYAMYSLIFATLSVGVALTSIVLSFALTMVYATTMTTVLMCGHRTLVPFKQDAPRFSPYTSLIPLGSPMPILNTIVRDK